MDHVEQVAGLIKQYENLAEKLRTIQALLADDPELIEDLRRILLPSPPLGPPGRAPRSRSSPTTCNHKATSGRLWARSRKGTHMPRSTVNFLLFASKHKGLFESEMRGPRRKSGG